jgi:hypothetical protein
MCRIALVASPNAVVACPFSGLAALSPCDDHYHDYRTD